MMEELITSILGFAASRPDILADDEWDRDALLALRDQSVPSEKRISDVLKFLHGYKVLMGFTAEDRERVAATVIGFFTRHRQDSVTSENDILFKFDALHDELRQYAPTARQRTDRRDVMSLTSKALWLCYPDRVPILDSYAEAALFVLSRYFNIFSTTPGHRYATFLHIWLGLWKQVEESLSTSDYDDCRYKIRIFDKYLWYLGQPAFEVARSPDSIELSALLS